MADLLSTEVGRGVSLAIAGVLLALVAARYLRRRREHEWKKLARHAGLKFRADETGPQVRGVISDRHVEIRADAESSDVEAGVVVTEIRIRVKDLPESMVAEAAPGMVGTLSNLAEQHILTGDEEFDRNVHLMGEARDRIQAYWSEPRRRAFLNLVATEKYDRLSLESAELRAFIRDAFPDRHQLEQLLQMLMTTASMLERPAPN